MKFPSNPGFLCKIFHFDGKSLKHQENASIQSKKMFYLTLVLMIFVPLIVFLFRIIMLFNKNSHLLVHVIYLASTEKPYMIMHLQIHFQMHISNHKNDFPGETAKFNIIRLNLTINPLNLVKFC